MRKTRVTRKTTAAVPKVVKVAKARTSSSHPRKPPDDPRHSYRFRLLREKLIQGAEACAICGKPFDLNAPPRTALRPSIDHIMPLAEGGDPFDVAQLRVVHIRCNSRRGGDLKAMRNPGKPRTARRISRDW